MLVSLLLLRTALHDPKEHDIQGSCCSSSRTPSTSALRLSSRCTARRARGGGPRNSAARAALQARGLTLACMLRVHAGARRSNFSGGDEVSRLVDLLHVLLLVLLVFVLTYCWLVLVLLALAFALLELALSLELLGALARRAALGRCVGRARPRPHAADARVAARGVGAATSWGRRRSAAAHRLGAELCAGGGRASGAAPNRRAAPDAALAAADAVAGTNASSSAPTPQFPSATGRAALVGPRVGKRAAAAKVYTSRQASRGWRDPTAAPPGRPPPLPPAAAVTAALLGKPSAPCDLKCGGCSSMVAATLPEGFSDAQCSECDANFTADVPPPQVAEAGGRRRETTRRRRAPRCRSARCGCTTGASATSSRRRRRTSTPPTTTRAPAGAAAGWSSRRRGARSPRRFGCGWPSARRWTRARRRRRCYSPPARRRQTRQRRRRIRTLGWEAS